MKNKLIATVALCLLLAGCSKEAPPATGQVSKAPPPPPVVLAPLYAEIVECLSQCESKWYRVRLHSGQSFSPAYEPKLPDRFSALVDTPDEQSRFAELIEQLPERLRPLGKLGPDDEEKTVNTGFGSYKHEKPKLYGELHNVIDDKAQVVYIYSNVYFFRTKSGRVGTMHVAVNPETREYAGVVRAGDSLDEYHVVGAQALRKALLTYTIADDLESADMMAHYANKAPGPYERNPIMLPLNKRLDAAIERTEMLSTKLGDRSQALGVPAPGALVQAEAARAASAWYGVSQGRDQCIESPMSPADRIDVIRSAGIMPKTRETISNGQVALVEISADDGRHETTWRFFKSKIECERTLPSSSPDAKYR